MRTLWYSEILDLVPGLFLVISEKHRQICANFWNNCGFLRTSVKLSRVIEHELGNIFRSGDA